MITSVSVTDRPDLMQMVRKTSDSGSGSKYRTTEGDSGSEGSGGGRNSVSSIADVMRGKEFCTGAI